MPTTAKTAAYHARCWATERTVGEIKEEIARCNARYFKPYPWNGAESAHYTLSRIEALEELISR